VRYAPVRLIAAVKNQSACSKDTGLLSMNPALTAGGDGRLCSLKPRRFFAREWEHSFAPSNV
jgi:hypothetical protein